MKDLCITYGLKQCRCCRRNKSPCIVVAYSLKIRGKSDADIKKILIAMRYDITGKRRHRYRKFVAALKFEYPHKYHIVENVEKLTVLI